MTNPAADEPSDYNSEIIKEFRANQGRVGGMWTGTTLILLHHRGAKSGLERVPPVACSPQGEGRFAVWCGQRRSARPPALVLQPQGPPQDHRRGGHPDIHGPGAGAR
jgi:F420H(2)-dependent quinone reductase